MIRYPYNYPPKGKYVSKLEWDDPLPLTSLKKWKAIIQGLCPVIDFLEQPLILTINNKIMYKNENYIQK